MSGRCRRAYDSEAGWFDLPGCIGGAVYGKSGCTCPGGDSGSQIEDRLQSIERTLKELTATLNPGASK
jgi:hypothetical protein